MKTAKIFFSIGLIFGYLTTNVGAEKAQSIFGKNMSLHLGIKAWRATYETQTFKTDDYIRAGGVESTSNMFGPSFRVQYKKYYIGGSYYFGGGFNGTAVDYYINQKAQHILGYKFEKKDMDILMGYYVNPEISVFIGYKRIETNGKFQWYTRTASTGYNETIEGPVFGMTLNLPLAYSGLTFFSTLGYATLNGKADYILKWTDADGNITEDKTSSSFDSLGPAIEFGFHCLLKDFPYLRFYVGYKYQEYKNPDIDDYSSKLYGLNISSYLIF
jgi:hypothetical protein